MPIAHIQLVHENSSLSENLKCLIYIHIKSWMYAGEQERGGQDVHRKVRVCVFMQVNCIARGLILQWEFFTNCVFLVSV